MKRRQIRQQRKAARATDWFGAFDETEFDDDDPGDDDTEPTERPPLDMQPNPQPQPRNT